MSQEDFKTLASTIAITDYINYRDFLNALYNVLKTNIKPYSFYEFSEDLGLSQSNVAWLIMSQRRRITLASGEKIAQALELSGIKRRYFFAMVHQNNTRKAETKEKHLAEMVRLKDMFVASDENSLKFSYLGKWYNPVIRELMSHPDFQSDPKWIAQQLYMKVLPREIQNSLSVLEKLNLVKFSRRLNKHQQTDQQIKITKEIMALGMTQYHQKMLEVASEALTLVPSRRREYNALTVCLSAKGAEKIRTLLIETCEAILKIEGECQGSNHVYQINLQFFPFTRES